VLDFGPVCGPCRAVDPILHMLDRRHADASEFAKLNIDENTLTAARYDVLSIPRPILFDKAARPERTLIGSRRRSHYEVR